MTRRCSHCCNNGHNSRTCPNRGVKIFGVRLMDGSIRKSASMGNLSHYAGSGLSSALPTNPGSPGDTPEHGAGADGYASEDFVPGSSSSCRERKKGVPWTEEEHRMFLLGLKKLGKGDWRGIARNFVVSRTPTQVASHAQKHFIRQTNISRRKRRSSLFDIVSDQQPSDVLMMPNGFSSTDHLEAEIVINPLPAPPTVDEECESMDSTNSNEGEMAPPKQETSLSSFPVLYPGFVPHYFPVSLPIQSELGLEALKEETSGVFKPKAIYTKSPLNVDELVGLSKLSLGDSLAHSGPSSLSINLRQGSARQSAFHANPSSESAKMNSSGSPIHAV